MTAIAPLTHAPPLLWQAARVLIQTIFALFGTPEEIAARHTHTGKERTLLLTFLRAGEAVMRHLLLIEASHVAKPNIRPLLRERRKRVGRLMHFTADNPEAWRVSFRCLQSSPARGGSAEQSEAKGEVARKTPVRLSREERWCAEHFKRTKFYSAWPLAERAEAMLRAFNNPEAYAQRLARRLHATPHRAAALTRHPPNLPHLVDDFDTLSEAALAARRRFESG